LLRRSAASPNARLLVRLLNPGNADGRITPMPIERGSQEVASQRVRHHLLNTAPVRVFVLLLLFTSAALREAAHLTSLADTDIWWHLRTGLWILQNHTVPHAGLFSQSSNLPWSAFSWGYEVLAATAYKLAGLRAIPVLLMGFKVALAGMTFLLARGSRETFWIGVLLSAVAQYAIPDLQPRPILCSIVLFAIELALLMRSRRTGSARSLYWLPLLFVAWANLHLQFMNGLLVLALFFMAALTEEVCRRNGATWVDGHAQALPLSKAGAVVGASFVATFLTPSSYHSYQLALKNASSTFLFASNPELHSLSFRRPEDYALLLLAMAAFLSLGRQRSRDLFKLSLMIVCMMFAFRIQRDTWFVVLPSIAVIGEAVRAASPAALRPDNSLAWDREKLTTAVLVLLVFLVATVRGTLSQEALLKKVGEKFPLRACQFIRDSHLPGPLFNEYEWGGFLIWYLPEYPVAMDDRQDLYGDETTERYLKVNAARAPSDAAPGFAQASTVLLKKSSGMAIALSEDPNFEVAYTDGLSTILLRRR
jgi:hypothetical protein